MYTPKKLEGLRQWKKLYKTLLQILFLNFSGASYNLPKLFLIKEIYKLIPVIITSSVNCLEALIMNI